MRRNRRGAGISGSTSFLARALKCAEADLVAGFTELGLVLAKDPESAPATIESGDGIWWLNQDQRGGVWINGREKTDEGGPRPEGDGSSAEAATPGAPAEASAADGAPSAPDPATAPLTAVRLLLKPTKTGAFADETGRLAEALGKTREDFLATLLSTGLKAPEKAREKPFFVEHAGEIFWLNRSAKDELWLNAKASKFADGGGEKRGPRNRGRKGAASAPSAEPTDAPLAEEPAVNPPSPSDAPGPSG
jgi:hypothetical protein